VPSVLTIIIFHGSVHRGPVTNVNGSRQEKLQDQSAEQFDKLYAERIPQRHSHVLLLGYALAQEALGFRHVEESTRLLEAAARSGGETPEVREQRGKANEHIEIGKSKLLQAQQALQALLARGELGLLAHYHLMQVSAALKDHAATFQHGDAYLAEVEKEKKAERARINATSQPKYERYLQSELDRIRKQELDVRELLALLHRNDGENDKQPDADRSRARQAALAHLDVVLQNDPTRSHDYYERALLLQALGRPDAARSDFRKFLATSPLPASSPKKADAVKALGMQ